MNTLTKSEVVKGLETSRDCYYVKCQDCRDIINQAISYLQQEPDSKDTIAKKIELEIGSWHKRLFGNDITQDDLAWYRKEIGKTIAEKIIPKQEPIGREELREQIITRILKVAMSHHDDISKSDEDNACLAADCILALLPQQEVMSEDWENIKVGDLAKHLKESYDKDKYHNSFAGNFRIGLIQQCNMYLEDLSIKKNSNFPISACCNASVKLISEIEDHYKCEACNSICKIKPISHMLSLKII